MNPSRAEKLYWNRLAAEVGCIACRIEGVTNHHVSIHHIAGRAKPGAHSNVLPLCFLHHQGGDGDEIISVHPWKARFILRYGSQESLKKKCNEILGAA